MGEEKKLVQEIPEDTLVLDLALIPQGRSVEKTLYLMKTQNVCVIDSFRGKAHNGPNPIPPYMLHSKRKLKYKIVEYKDFKEEK
jgi:hypothetical protein